MKKQSYLLIGLTSLLFILFLTNSLLDILNLDWSYFATGYRENRETHLLDFGL